MSEDRLSWNQRSQSPELLRMWTWLRMSRQTENSARLCQHVQGPGNDRPHRSCCATLLILSPHFPEPFNSHMSLPNVTRKLHVVLFDEHSVPKSSPPSLLKIHSPWSVSSPSSFSATMSRPPHCWLQLKTSQPLDSSSALPSENS